MTNPQSMVAAFFCTFIWGTTFIAQDTGMELIGPYVFNTTRFFVGFLALIPFYLFLEKKTTREVLSKNRNRFIYLSIAIGIFLFLASLLQQVALLFTDVANAAFITIFYVPMVPIIKPRKQDVSPFIKLSPVSAPTIKSAKTTNRNCSPKPNAIIIGMA